MDQKFTHIERIEQYFNNKLSQKEATAFEKEMQENEELAREVADFELIQKGLTLVGEEEDEEIFNSVFEELKSENFFNQTAKIKPIMEKGSEGKSRNLFRIISLAASVLIVATAAYFFMRPVEPTRAELLAKAEVKPDIEFADALVKKNASLGFADPEKGKKDTVALIANHYKEGKYDNAIRVINEYIEHYDSDFDVKYMLGSCMFQTGEYAKAVKHFLPLLEDKASGKRQDIQWMTALCYLKFNTPVGDNNAKKILQQLSKDPGDFEPQVIQQYLDFIR